MKNTFEEIWGRIKKETDLKSLKDLGQVIDKTQQTISYSKTKNDFSPAWAYLVGRKYDLLTEWIMTGEGPKRLGQISQDRKFDILNDVESWLDEITKREPYRKEWFQAQLEDAFPAFKAWKEGKEEKAETEVSYPESKVA